MAFNEIHLIESLTVFKLSTKSVLHLLRRIAAQAASLFIASFQALLGCSWDAQQNSIEQRKSPQLSNVVT